MIALGNADGIAVSEDFQGDRNSGQIYLICGPALELRSDTKLDGAMTSRESEFRTEFDQRWIGIQGRNELTESRIAEQEVKELSPCANLRQPGSGRWFQRQHPGRPLQVTGLWPPRSDRMRRRVAMRDI